MIISNAQAHHFNLLLPRGSCRSVFFYLFIFCITKTRKKLDVDLTVNKTEKALLSYSSRRMPIVLETFTCNSEKL